MQFTTVIGLGFVISLSVLFYLFNKNNNDNNKNSNTIRIDEFIDSCCQRLEEGIKGNTKKQKKAKSCIRYLKREDVKKRAIEIANRLKFCELKGMFSEVLDVIFLTIEAKIEDEGIYILNFWPNDNYVSIDCKEKKDT